MDSIADFVRGVSFTKSDATAEETAGSVPVLRAGNIQNGHIVWNDLVFVPDKFVSPSQRLRLGDIVVVMSSGSVSVVGKAAPVDDHDASRVAGFGAFCGLWRPNSFDHAAWIQKFFQTSAYRQTVSAAAAGVNINNLRADHIGSLPIPVPPLNEQRRIVAKLEALQARSRRAREALDAVPPLLEKLRQSILAAAFRGDLTKDWRAKHQTPRAVDLPVSAGVDTRQLRKRLWGSGRTADGVSPAWGEIPGSWKWVQVRDLNEDPGMAVQIGPMSMKSAEFVDEGTVVLNVGCVQRGRVDVTKADHLPSERARDFERYRLRTRDVLFTRSGTVGRCACLPESLDGALMTFHLLRVRPSDVRCAPAFLMYAFQGCGSVAAQIEVSSVGATRAGFNTRLLEEMWIPLAPREEQEELLLRLSEHMLRIDGLRAQLAGLLRTLDSLECATLAKAFRGELVPQDPNDEPAEVTLARARSTNGSTPSNGSPPKRGRPRAAQRAEPPND